MTIAIVIIMVIIVIVIMIYASSHDSSEIDRCSIPARNLAFKIHKLHTRLWIEKQPETELRFFRGGGGLFSVAFGIDGIFCVSRACLEPTSPVLFVSIMLRQLVNRVVVHHGGKDLKKLLRRKFGKHSKGIDKLELWIEINCYRKHASFLSAVVFNDISNLPIHSAYDLPELPGLDHEGASWGSNDCGLGP